MSMGSIDSSGPPTEMPTIPTINMHELDRSVAVEALPEDYFSPTEQSVQELRGRSPYHESEPSRSYHSPNSTTLDLSRLAREVGVNQHPWSMPRSSTPVSPRASTSAVNRSVASPSSPPPRPSTSFSQHQQLAPVYSRAASPFSPTEHHHIDHRLLSSENVVRVGKGYESSRSHHFRNAAAPTSSSTFYDQQQSSTGASTSTPHLLAPVENIAPLPPRNSLRAATAGKKNAHRRSGMFATFLGRELGHTHDGNVGISSASYFAGVGEFGAVGGAAPVLDNGNAGTYGTTLMPPPMAPHDPWAEFDSETPRSNTLSKRFKKAFSRVVSNPGLNRAIPA